MSTLVQQGLSVIQAPPALPPSVGLIPTCARLGVGTYLVDDVVESADELLHDSQGNLLSSPTSLDQRWVFGFRWLPEQSCQLGTTRDPCADTTLVIPQVPGYGSLSGGPGVFTGSGSWEVGIPAIIETGDATSTFGWEAHNYRERAARALLAVESYQAAFEFWTGTVARASGWSNQYLQAGLDTAAGAVHDLTGGTAVTPGAALALLEQGIATHHNGQPAAIHCTRQLGAALSELGNTFRSVDGLIYTYLGTVIIPDAGYPGSGAAGEAVDGSQWAFATGLPTVRRSPIQIIPDTFAEALDRSKNALEFRALRSIAVTIPPCPVLTAKITLTVPT